MTVAPAGFLSAPVADLRAMVAQSQTFRAWVGAADQSSALARVHTIAAPRVEDLPMALVEIGEHIRQRTMVAGGYSFETGAGSHLILTFRSDAEGSDEPDAGFTFLNAIGGIIADVEKLSGDQSSPHITIPAISMAAIPQRIRSPNRQSVGDFYEASFIIQQGFRS